MGGLFLDIYIEFIFRALVRFFRARGSKSWPVVRGKVTATHLKRSGLGCAVAEIAYKYRVEGELYTGSSATPFIWTSSAEEYLERYSQGSELLIRAKPGAPENSLVRNHDLYLHEHGYQPETK